jgi:hypothetical protein
MSAVLLAAWFIGLRPQVKDVDLAFGLHSYRQLAAELTEAGIPTQCEPSIRQRFALIRIPPRRWDSLRTVLEAALDVQFVPTSAGPLEIRKNPKVADLDDMLLKRLSRLYSQTLQTAVQDGLQQYRGIESIASPRATSEAIANMLDAIRSLPVGNADRNALSVGVNLKQEIGRRYVYAELWDGIDITKLLKGLDPIASTAEQVATTPPPDNPVGEITPPPIKSFRVRLLDGEAGLAPIQIDNWYFDPRTFTLARDHVEEIDITSTGFGHGVTELVPDTVGFECGWDDLFRGVKGQGALRDRMAVTSAWLTTPAASQRFTLSQTDDTVSSLFERWSEAVQTPLIMELLPNRELLSDPGLRKTPAASIAEFFKSRSEEAVTPRFLKSAWTVEEISGVTVVRDEIRFADHATPFSPEAAIALARARAKSADSLNTVSDLIDAAILLPAESHAAIIGLDAYGVLSDLPFAAPYLRLIQSDPQSAQGLRALRKIQELRIPFTTFSGTARRKFEKAIRELALRNPSNWSAAVWPEFDQVLASATVVAVGKPTSGGASIGFYLTSPVLKVPRTGLCPISLEPISMPD